MATLAELEDALKNADAAGAVDDARQLADAIVAMRSQAPVDAGQASINGVKQDGSTNIPQWARNNPRLYGVAGALREAFGPAVEAVAMGAGAAAGTTISPIVGTVAGGAGGYALGTGLTRMADEALGNRGQMTTSDALATGTKDLITGATWQAATPLISNVIGKVIEKATPFVSKVGDIGQLGKQKASKIAREAVGNDLAAVKAALTDTPLYGQTTAGELTANINNPTWQALVERGLGRDPKFTMAVQLAAKNNDINTLVKLAGGNTQTASIAAQRSAKAALNDSMMPTLEAELGAANTAGRLKPRLDAEAQRMANAAAAKVEDVRRMTAAGERAATRANTTTGQAAMTAVPGYPRQPGRYTYMGELEKKAEQVAQQAADASLPFGEASRFAKAASDSLEAHGLRPLTAESIVSKLRSIKGNPKLAGLAEVEASLAKLGDDLQQWTKSGGVIDAWAVDSIRKNSVNGAIQKLHPTMDSTQQKRLAATVMDEVKPRIIKAIEEAGGTGYGQYLKDYASGAQKIDQKKMGAKILELYNANPGSAAKAIEGDAPQRVEKVFGPGRVDIRREMSPSPVDIQTSPTASPMDALDALARGVRIREGVAKQASTGQEALRELLEENALKFKLPWFANAKATATNAALGIAEKNIGKNAMNELTKSFKSGKDTLALLNTLPAHERVKLLRALSQINSSPLLRGSVPGLAAMQEEETPTGLLAY